MTCEATRAGCRMAQNKASRAITIKDVSERAGVAISTVSKVLNDGKRVSDETRERVRVAAEELGYVRNRLAASMKTGSSKLVVVVVPDIINEYYTAVVRGVEDVSIANGYFTLLFSTDDSHHKEQELFSGEFGRIIDGAIIIPAYDNLSYYRNLDKPVVIIDRDVASSNMHSVVIDNFKGGYLLAEELLRAGHRNIGYVTGSMEFNVGQDRLNGFREALKTYGVPENPENVFIDSWYAKYGYESTRAMLGRADPPTAIVAANNLLCIGCVQAIHDMNLSVGRDISLVGFDDSAVAELVDGGITVIRRATVEMGRIGMEKLRDIVEGRSAQYPRKTVLGVELVRRRSVASV